MKVSISMYLCKYNTTFYHLLKSLPIDKWENETIVLLQVILITGESEQFGVYFFHLHLLIGGWHLHDICPFFLCA